MPSPRGSAPPACTTRSSTRRRRAASGAAAGHRVSRPPAPGSSRAARTSSWFPSLTVNPGSTAVARSPNSVNAGYRSQPPAGRGSRGTGSAATGQRCSHPSPSRSRLVVSSRSPGAARSRRSARSAHASTRCSQLSRITSDWRSRRCSASTVAWLRPVSSCTPRDSSIVCAMSAGSCRPASSTSHTPSSNARCSPAAVTTAKRVLPTPPTPVSVTSLALPSRRLTSATSCLRPTKLVVSAGRLPRLRVAAAIPTRPTVGTSAGTGQRGPSEGATLRDPARCRGSARRRRASRRGWCGRRTGPRGSPPSPVHRTDRRTAGSSRGRTRRRRRRPGTRTGGTSGARSPR